MTVCKLNEVEQANAGEYMRLRHIEVFNALYISKSVSSAARFLNVSQPSVSKVLRHAEDQLGYRLFDRTVKGLVPTSEGRKLYESVSELYRHLGNIQRLSESLKDLSEGSVRVAVTPTLGVGLLPDAVASFAERHDHVTFEIATLHHGEIVDALVNRQVDIGIAFDSSSREDIKEERIGGGEFVCIAPSDQPLPDGRVDMASLSEYRFISLNARSPLGRLLMDQQKLRDLDYNVIAEVETYHIAKSLVSRGMGIAIVDEITAFSEDSEHVKIARLKHPVKYDVHALTLAGDPVPLVCQEFIRHFGRVMSLSQERS